MRTCEPLGRERLGGETGKGWRERETQRESESKTAYSSAATYLL